MMTMELLVKPMIATITIDEKELCVNMVLVVRDYTDVFPDDLPYLSHDWEIEFGIDVVSGIAPISKASLSYGTCRAEKAVIGVVS